MFYFLKFIHVTNLENLQLHNRVTKTPNTKKVHRSEFLFFAITAFNHALFTLRKEYTIESFSMWWKCVRILKLCLLKIK